MSYIISDSAYLTFSAVLQTNMDKPGNVLSCNAAWQVFGSYLCTHSRPPAHIKGSVASLHNTCVGTAPASCIPGVAVLAVLALVV